MQEIQDCKIQEAQDCEIQEIQDCERGPVNARKDKVTTLMKTPKTCVIGRRRGTKIGNTWDEI